MRGTWVRIVASWQMGSEEGFRKLQSWDDGILFVFLPQLQVPTFQSEVWIRTKNNHQQSHVEKLSSAVQCSAVQCNFAAHRIQVQIVGPKPSKTRSALVVGAAAPIPTRRGAVKLKRVPGPTCTLHVCASSTLTSEKNPTLTAFTGSLSQSRHDPTPK